MKKKKSRLPLAAITVATANRIRNQTLVSETKTHLCYTEVIRHN